MDNNLPTFEAPVAEVLKFLTTISELLKTHGTLNTYRSALSLILNYELGSNPIIKRFCKGFSVMKPSNPKYSDTWDPDIVLDYLIQLGPNAELGLAEMSKKLVTLLALSTAQRMQTLTKIKISNIKVTNDSTKIYIYQTELKPLKQEKNNQCYISH